MSEYSMTIDGKSIASDQTIGAINPATEAVYAHCPDNTPAQLRYCVPRVRGSEKLRKLE